MIEIGYLKEGKKVNILPQELQQIIQGILEVLDTEYGADRNIYENDGGYVIVVETKEDFEKMENTIGIDCDIVTPEYVDKVVCDNSEIYTNSLILCNNEFGISLIIPMELTPQNLKNYIME